MGKFEEGNSGKPKGAVNKVTQEARELFVCILEGEVQHIKSAFEAVRNEDSVKYLELYAKYAQYFVPKKSEVTANITETRQVFKIGDQEIEL